MYISNLKIDRFGNWKDLSLDGFSAGLNVIYGPAGSGKKAIVEFVRSMLYGFADETRLRFTPPGTRDAKHTESLCWHPNRIFYWNEVR